MRPILFFIGRVPVWTYGTMAMIAILFAYVGMCLRAHREGIDWDHVTNLFFLSLFSVVGGGRLLYVLTYSERFRGNWIRALYVWDGGLTLYGGLLVGLASWWVYCRLRGLSTAHIMDMAAPFCSLATGLGRVGCFGFGCCYGKPTDLPWGIRFWTDPLKPAVPRHPTQIYEALFLFGLAVVLDRLYRRKHWEGQVLVTYLYAYGAWRILIEFLRADVAGEHYLLGLTLSQSISLVGLVVVAGLHWVLRRRVKS